MFALRQLFTDIEDETVEREHRDLIIQENFFRMYLVSLIILALDILTFIYVALAFKRTLYLSFVVIPVCLLNIAVWRVDARKHFMSNRAKHALVYVNNVLALGLGALWNLFMKDTLVALPLYMCTVAIVAGAYIMRPSQSLYLFAGTGLLFSLNLLPVKNMEGWVHTLGLIHSTFFTIMAWVIATMLFSAHRKHHLAQTLLEEKSALLEQLYVTDRLTGLYNRHMLEDAMEKEVNRVDRYGHALSVVILDVDGFKRVNDEYGHLTGDAVLREISDIMHSFVRKTDVLGRWGGDEFLIICPDSTAEQTRVVAERIRARVSVRTLDNGRRVTLSIGLGSYVRGEGKESFIRRVDNLMYEAKGRGGNQIAEIH